MTAGGPCARSASGCWQLREKTDVVLTPEMGPIREHIKRGLETAKGTPLHITLQELETVDGKPERLREWAAMAKEVGSQMA
jgi:hypothetical protein